jgi:hypothetical protein
LINNILSVFTTHLITPQISAGFSVFHAVSQFFWVLDITTTFVGRNPFRYTNPAAILGCFAYNCASMMAGEIGYNIWKLTK